MNDSNNLAPNLRRDWIWDSDSDREDDGSDVTSFSLMNYNVLADCHFLDGWYPYCPEGYRKMSDRHRQLMAELTHHDPDIVCLQEVGPDYFAGQLNPAMFSLGYQGCFMNKVRGIREGGATFYKRDRFVMLQQRGAVFNELVAEKCREASLSIADQEKVQAYTDRSQLVLLTKLQDIKTKHTLAIGNTHLLFDDYKNIDIITLQAGLAINALLEFAGGPDNPHILCGDFNQEPTMTGYHLMHDGKLDKEGKEFIQQYPVSGISPKKTLLDLLPHYYQHNSGSLQSAYKSVVRSEIPFTNYDDYIGEEWPPTSPDMELDSEVTLDYQWYSSNSLTCGGVLQMIDKSLIRPFHACPNEVFPSDHLPVLARYHFRTERELKP